MYNNIQELRKAIPDLFTPIDAIPENQDYKGVSITKSEDENHIQVMIRLEYPEFPNKSISSSDSAFIWTLENNNTGLLSSFAHVYDLDEPEVFVSMLSCKYIDPNSRITKRYKANTKSNFMPTESELNSHVDIMKNKEIALPAIIDLCNKVKNIHKEVTGYIVRKGEQFSITFNTESTSKSHSLASETIQLVSLTTICINEFIQCLFSRLPENPSTEQVTDMINQGGRAIVLSSPSSQYIVSNEVKNDKDTTNKNKKIAII